MEGKIPWQQEHRVSSSSKIRAALIEQRFVCASSSHHLKRSHTVTILFQASLITHSPRHRLLFWNGSLFQIC